MKPKIEQLTDLMKALAPDFICEIHRMEDKSRSYISRISTFNYSDEITPDFVSNMINDAVKTTAVYQNLLDTLDQKKDEIVRLRKKVSTLKKYEINYKLNYYIKHGKPANHVELNGDEVNNG